MPGADEIHSPLWKEQQWLTGSQRAKNKSGLSRRWCAARVPLVVSPCAAWCAHTFLMSHKRLLALMLIHLLVVFCVRAAALEATLALAEVVNSGFVRHRQKKSYLTIADLQGQSTASSLSLKRQISLCRTTQSHFMKLHWHHPNMMCVYIVFYAKTQYKCLGGTMVIQE